MSPSPQATTTPPARRQTGQPFHRFVTVRFAAASTVRFAAASVDLEITWSPATASVADLIHAAAREVESAASGDASRGDRCHTRRVVIDGRTVSTATALERAGIMTGSIIDCRTEAPGPTSVSAAAGAASIDPDPGVATLLTVDHVAGRDAGLRLAARDGASLILRHRDGTMISAQVTTGPIRADSGDRWGPGHYVEVGAEVVAIEMATSADTGPAESPDRGACGQSVVVNRPPRVVPPDRAELPTRPEVPARPAAAPPLSWASLVAPIPIGVAMALLFRPYFLLFTAAGPVMFLGRWWEGRRRHRRACIEWEREVYDRNADYQLELEAMTKLATVEQRRRQPTICQLLDRIEQGARSLWERRPNHEDFAVVAVAYGATTWPDPTRATLVRGGADRSGPPVSLEMVPLVVDLRRHHVVGIVGTDAALDLARAMVLQLAALHGPAHLRVGMSIDAAEGWEWMKWLPHHLPLDDDVAALADHDATTLTSPWAIRVLVGGAESTEASSIIVAPSPDAVPTTCSLLIDCRNYEKTSRQPRVDIIDVEAGTTTSATNMIGLQPSRAEAAARGLARFIDPEVATGSGGLPKAIALADLEAWYSPDPILRAWHDGDSDHLRAAIGAGPGPYEIDLVRDGPHALVAGTTGSGKSELLRTWVAALAGRHSPRDCVFVLIDFKGGGAFDAVATLPHVAAVVTDLDEGLAQRGLRSLRAELRDREHRLRGHGATDIEHYRRLGCRDLPRLVLIIDEFATLAAELPAFLDGLVDIAQRGRSLGVHMVLATQRPAGVLDQKIRANTNLRICLRVQDSADSVDVINGGDAARLPRNRPGRALVRIGAEELDLIQGAHIGPSETEPRPSLRYRRFAPHQIRPWRPDATEQPGAVERILEASRRCTRPELVAPPRPPWCAPLPTSLPRAALWDHDPPHLLAVPIGIEDRPDERVQKVWYWDRSAGPLLVVGGSDGERRAVIASVIDGVGRADASTDTYVVHTEVGATPFGIGGWPGAIEADDVESIDRVLLRCANAGPHSAPLVVIIERFDLLGVAATEADAAIVREHLERVVAQSSRSVSFVIGGATERSIPSRVAAHASQRLVLRLADAGAYAAVGLRERTMPQITVMGAVDPRESTAIRLAGTADEDYGALRFPATEPVRTAPERLVFDELAPDPRSVGSLSDGELALAIGLDLVSQRPFVARVTPDEPFIVVGERRTGRTSGLGAFVECARRVQAQVGPAALGCVVFAGVARRASTYRRWGADLAVWSHGTDSDDPEPCWAERIEALASPTIIVVDDGDRIDDNEGTVLADAARAGGHYLIVASTSDTVRSLRSWTSSLRAARNGIVLGFGRSDAEILRSSPLRFCGIEWQPGRGIAASQSEPTLVQLLATAATADTR